MLGAQDSESPYPAPGAVLDGKYVVRELIGSGGMGVVVRAVHVLRRAPVALKFLNPAMMAVDGGLSRFLREAVAASAVQTEHVVRVFDVGTLPNGVPYLVMELLVGRDLSDLVRTEGKPGLEPARAVHCILQVLRALQAAHGLGIVHRDLKLSNCFVISHEGDRDFVKVLDFGVSKLRSSETALTKANSALGTPMYMAPEQATAPREVDERSDIYSVGVMLYKCLSGELPYRIDSKNAAVVIQQLLTAVPRPLGDVVAGLPPGLAEVAHRAMARAPADRFASAVEMAEALAPFADGRSARVLSALRDFQRDHSGQIGADIDAVLKVMEQGSGELLTPVSNVRGTSLSATTLSASGPPARREPAPAGSNAPTVRPPGLSGISQIDLPPSAPVPSLTTTARVPRREAPASSGGTLRWVVVAAVLVLAFALTYAVVALVGRG